ncbi:hypothetical protein XNC1_3094 [Xenorhabdus nematophila ATCC 19061]|uniref:Uncharacterized protein n=1 Tax=Xenorhabdus nematophila (strain ATCC 19061 / DSM 3370 / CCUG 14189 / LMG 1036 / NCIMB 9965 / AN6) TaxID=406817 RepID=D3VKP0_XENNA|nr:DUF2732 family protein [Xenorhabdus nematophila]CBJ91148.1 hypothetical protein XNC1_3094 [Xenorhabdus nematophila ATCC 19061]CEK23970.1 hypothetical protein XNC2_2976 [Xenorhabdus nematophila AN6/1]
MKNKKLMTGYDPAESQDAAAVCITYKHAEQLIKKARREERQHWLVKLSAHVLDKKMGPSDSAALLQSESEQVGHQAQEWNHV